MNRTQLELPVKGMDCAECTQHVQQALCTLPGIESAEVFLSSEKAVVRYDSTQVDLSTMRRAVEAAGYSIPLRVIELRVKGMDCAECSQHVQHALAAVPGVESADVFLTSQKAVLLRDRIAGIVEDFLNFRQRDLLRIIGNLDGLGRNIHANGVYSCEFPKSTLNSVLAMLARNVRCQQSCRFHDVQSSFGLA